MRQKTALMTFEARGVSRRGAHEQGQKMWRSREVAKWAKNEDRNEDRKKVCN